MFDNPILPVVQLICTIYIIVYQIIIANLQIKRLFFLLNFLDNNMTKTAKKECRTHTPTLTKSLYNGSYHYRYMQR